VLLGYCDNTAVYRKSVAKYSVKNMNSFLRVVIKLGISEVLRITDLTLATCKVTLATIQST
jgi:hypothetical protein